MSIHQILFGGYENPLRVVDGADFDGTNDYMARGSDLTGNADSKSGILSVWMRNDVNQLGITIENALERCMMQWVNSPTNQFYIQTCDTAGAINLNMSTSAGYVASSTWYHILASWDLAAAATHLYVNGIADKTINTGPVNSTIDYTDTNWSVGATPGGAVKYNGCLAELYFAPGQYLDFSLLANRRRFISALGKPVHLGPTGNLPTGIAPIIYLHLDDGEAVANFATNRGTGGNFTITGTVDTASTSPSD